MTLSFPVFPRLMLYLTICIACLYTEFYFSAIFTKSGIVLNPSLVGLNAICQIKCVLPVELEFKTEYLFLPEHRNAMFATQHNCTPQL